MVFELGKYYKHSGGGMLHTIALAETSMYGRGLVVEEAGSSSLYVVGQDETHSINYAEIDKKEWNQFYGIIEEIREKVVVSSCNNPISNRFEILDL